MQPRESLRKHRHDVQRHKNGPTPERTPVRGDDGPIRVAVCQVPCKDSALQENLAAVEHAAREAAGLGARLACFPESMDLGWVNTEAHHLAEPIPGPVSRRIAEIARGNGLTMAVGLTERMDGGIADTAVLVDPTGTVILKHRKINTLAELLHPPYVRGRKEDIDVADTPLGRLGMLICADTFEGDILGALAAKEPDIVLVPFGWAAPPEDWPGHGDELRKTVARAARTLQAPVIGANSIGRVTTGPWRGRTYEGESAATDERGDVLYSGPTGRPEVAVIEVRRW